MKTFALNLYMLFIPVSLLAQANSYYVAANGNDTNNGLSKTTPFKTLEKLNTVNLYSGCNIYLNRGDVFRGGIIVNTSGTAGKPILIDAYGQGNKPVINGAFIITQWQMIKPNIWEAPFAKAGETVTGVNMNGTPLPLGRYPNLKSSNKGYLTIISHADKTSLTAYSIAGRNWEGGEIVYRPEQWILERSKIISQDKGTLTLNGSEATYNIKDKWGFFIQDHPATLDQNGEWYYDKAKKTLLLYSEENPNTKIIEATASDGIRISDASFVTVQNIKISSTLKNAIFAKNSSNLIINDNEIINSGENAITITGKGNALTITNNRIKTVNNNGVDINGYSNLIFKNNTLKGIGLLPGRGKGKDLQYFGVIYINPENTGHALMENNNLDSLAYCGIRFQSSNIIIRHNIISNFNMIKGDGGGIYTFNYTGKVPKPYREQYIDSNIISKGHTAFEGTNGKYPESNSNGIYLDFASQNVVVRGNTIFDCPSAGIYMIATNHITVQNNTCYDNGAALFMLDKPFPSFYNNLIKDNVFFARNNTQLLVRIAVKADTDIPITGAFSNNTYSDFSENPFQIKNVLKTYKISMSNWRQIFKQDNNVKAMSKKLLTPSKSSAVLKQTVAPDKVAFYYNSSKSAKQINLTGAHTDTKNNPTPAKIILKPYTSVLLLKR